ncbi:MAG TPA: pyruvate kinase [Anaerolineaceae bacterium]|nr:pyruvate kinase [Anaerolineaceae bacterium]
MRRYAKIVATLGPSCQDNTILEKLVKAGLDVARLNFSHGLQSEHAERIATLRKLSDKYRKPIPIMQDLQGPKIRVGQIPDEPIQLTPGQTVIISIVPGEARSHPASPIEPVIIPTDFKELPECVKQGMHILLDDGQLEMEVLSVEDGRVKARVILGGPLTSHKGVNLPGAQIPIPGFTEKDREDLAFGLQQSVDMVAISFVRTAEDLVTVRNFIRENAPEKIDIPLVAKLERPEALKNLDEILKVTNGVMVARGDLGVEMPPATVPIAQKTIINAANRAGKFVITATQMLDSMIHNPRPTRAEASDVANAIFDGTDAVMLSGETAAGKYPVESVTMMDAIVREAEDHFSEWGKSEGFIEDNSEDDAVAITRAAKELAHDRNVAAIAVFTITGRTALLMSKARPQVPILGLTPEVKVYQKMGIYWGLIPRMVPFASTFEEMIKTVEDALRRDSIVQVGQQFVLISGYPIGAFRHPNLAMLYTLES